MTAGANRLTGHATLTVASNDLRVLCGAFKQLGYVVEELLATAGLQQSDLADPDARLPCTAYSALLNRAQQVRFTPNLALRLALVVPIGAYPLLDYLVVTSDSVGEGLQQLARYFRLVGNPVVLEPREGTDAIDMVMTGAAMPFSVEYLAALIVLHMRKETEGKFTAAGVSFMHRPDDAAEFERALGCPVASGAAWNGVSISRDVWRLPLRRRDGVLRGVLERQADQALSQLPEPGDPVAEVRRVLAWKLGNGGARIEAIARQLATSPRTLQRRLAAGGISFQQLLDDVRKQAALQRVAHSAMSICEIAYLLGYSEPGPFHRAFKRWYGETPQAFRKNHR
jgi:AraC-like DNA-binding protein